MVPHPSPGAKKGLSRCHRLAELESREEQPAEHLLSPPLSIAAPPQRLSPAAGGSGGAGVGEGP